MKQQFPPLFPRSVASILLGLMLGACGSSDPSTTAPPVLTNPDAEFRGLRVIGDKNTFTQAMREALVNQYENGGYYDLNFVGLPETEGPVPPAVSSPSPEPVSDVVSTVESADVTTTNVQEVGVDEADRVKSDGRYMYVMGTLYSGETPIPVDVPLPVTVTVPEEEAPRLVSRLSLPYYGDNQTEIRILSLDSESATTSPIHTVTIDTVYEKATGLYLNQTGNENSLIVTSSSLGGYWGYWHSPIQFMDQRSTIRKIDVGNPATAAVTDSLSLDGQLISSRRIGNNLYVATRFFPSVPGVEPYVTEQSEAEQSINSTAIEDLLPTATRESDNSVQALADANNCFVAERPASGYYSPDVITLAVINLSDLSVSDSVCYLGNTETLYASPNAIYLATTQYGYSYIDDIAIETDGTSPAILEYDPRVTTDIHQFTIGDGQLSYTGSGEVRGHLGWNDSQKPFRMSEHNGYLRVATYSEEQNLNTSPVIVSVLQPAGNNQLTTVATLPNAEHPAHIGKPREQLHASRFLGDKGYLVTFRQTDPLYVIDFSNPEDPVIAGELEIDGYSDYLHPIDENYLLGIGKGAIPAPGDPNADRGAFATGVKVTLFDVSNPATPTEVQSIEIGKRGTQSSALQDHHGITVQAATNEHPTRLTFGIDVHDVLYGPDYGPSTWYDWRESGLFAFEINTGNNAGITEQGKMIVETNTNGQYWNPSRGDDRSVIVNDAVFYVHGQNVYGANWNSLTNIDGPR